MGKYAGNIGFSITTETRPGIYEETITERKYCGDLIRNMKKWQNGQSINDDLNVSNQISILADPFVYSNIGNIKYVTLWNSKWKVNDVEVNYPRVTLNVGGLYNE